MALSPAPIDCLGREPNPLVGVRVINVLHAGQAHRYAGLDCRLGQGTAYWGKRNPEGTAIASGGRRAQFMVLQGFVGWADSIPAPIITG